MQTNRLRQFRTLVETRNMRKAAQLLGISSGGLSRSIGVLESELGIKLILSAGRGIAITDHGLEIYSRIPAILHHIETLREPGQKISNDPILRLGTFEVFSTNFLSSLIKKHLPEHELLLREYAPGKLELAVLQNIVEFGISYLPIPQIGIDFIEMGKLEMGIFGLNKAFETQPIEKVPFVAPAVPVEGSPNGMKGLDGWPNHEFPRTIRFHVEMLESALALCREGLCVGFFPQFVIDLHNQIMLEKFHLRSMPLPTGFKAITRPAYLVKKSSRQEEYIMRKIAKAMRAICV